ncbi:putative fructoselysine utilization operon transcriptional repressor [anaerobic digester metagenome]
MKKVNLDSNISSYLYEQVSNYIEIMIEKGTLTSGSKIPSEQELCELFNTSRITVRRAIKELSDKGVLEAVHGKGTFVSSKIKKSVHILEFGGFADGLGGAGVTFTKKILSKGLHMADEAEKIIFQRTEPFELFTLVRLVFDAEGPFSLDFAFFPADRYPGIMDRVDSDTSTFELARKTYGIHFKRVTKTIEFLTGDEEAAKILGVPLTTPLVLVKKTIFDEQDRPVHFSRYYLLPQKAELSFEVRLD